MFFSLWYTAPAATNPALAGIIPVTIEAPPSGSSPSATLLDPPSYWKRSDLPAATQAEMEAGTEAGVRAVSPLGVSQAINALGLALENGAIKIPELASDPSAPADGALLFYNSTDGAVRLVFPTGTPLHDLT